MLLKRGNPYLAGRSGFFICGSRTETMNKAAQLERLLGERILILDGAMGTMIQSYKLAEADYRGERFAAFAQDLQGQQRPAVADAAGHHPRDPRRLSGRGRRHHFHQHLQRQCAVDGRLRPAGPGVRDSTARRRASRARPRTPACTRRPGGSALSPACSARRPRPPRFRPTSTTRVFATSTSTPWSPPTASRCAACSTAART